MAGKFTNRAVSTLASAITSGATSLTVQAGHGARFPALAAGDYYYLVIQTGDNDTDPREYCYATARATDTMTIVRAQDGSAAQAFAAGSTVSLVLTKGQLEDLVQRGGSSMYGALSIIANGVNPIVQLTDTTGGPNIRMTGDGAVTPNKTIRVAGGAFQIINSGYTASIFDVDDTGAVLAGDGFRCRSGSGGAAIPNRFNIYWTGSAAQLWIDSSNIGSISVTSDERIKKDITFAQSNTDAFMAIRPIEFDYAKTGIFKPSGRRHFGFSANNLYEVFRPAVNGTPTDVSESGAIQPMDVNDRAILALATLEIQRLVLLTRELKADIEALKKAPA